MKRSKLLLNIVVLSSALSLRAVENKNNPGNLLNNILSGHVDTAFFCRLVNAFESTELMIVGKLSDKEKNDVLDNLKDSAPSDGIHPLSGIYGYLVFLDDQGNIIAIVSTFRKTNIISIQSGHRFIDKLHLGLEDGSREVVYKENEDLKILIRDIHLRFQNE